MPEEFKPLLVTGAFTLIGVIIGGTLPFFIELFRRIWIVSDRKYERTKEVLDRRCDQAETYVQNATEDFRRFMDDTGVFLFDTQHDHALERNQARRKSRDEFDMKIFALGAAISALGNEELKHIYDSMMDEMDKLHISYAKSLKYRFEGETTIEPTVIQTEVQNTWLVYSRLLGQFYKKLDEIRNSALR